MAVPEFQTFLLPLLAATGDGQEHRLRDLIPSLADTLNLTDEDRAQRLSSGAQSVAENRVYLAGTYLRKAGLLSSPARGVVVITTLCSIIRSTSRGPSIKTIFFSIWPTLRSLSRTNSRKSTTTTSKMAARSRSDETRVLPTRPPT